MFACFALLSLLNLLHEDFAPRRSTRMGKKKKKTVFKEKRWGKREEKEKKKMNNQNKENCER